MPETLHPPGLLPQSSSSEVMDESRFIKSQLPGTALVLREPRTGNTVFIVGCVHGSRASEEDVTTIMKG